jgi:hypothetical protein
MALYLNLMDNVTKPIVASALVSSLAKHGNRTQSGLVGASYLLQALQAAALHELALIIASAVDEPSFWATRYGAARCVARRQRPNVPELRPAAGDATWQGCNLDSEPQRHWAALALAGVS